MSFDYKLNVMKLKYTGLLIVAAGLLFGSCKKQTTVFDNPYAGGKAALGIVTDPQQIPVPETGAPGTEVTITATGLMPYKDQLLSGTGANFLFNGNKAVVKEVTDKGIKVVVPTQASTGVTAFVVGTQLVFGPNFTVQGKVNVDPTWVTAATGANSFVNRAFVVPASNNLIILGGFTDYDNKGLIKRVSRIARISAVDGSWDRSFLSGYGANAALNAMALVGPYYYIAGDITGYAQQANISRITRISTSGVIDTVPVITYKLAIKFVPAFNGGVTGGNIDRVYAVGADRMIVTGTFNYYVSRRYDQNTYDYKDSTVIDSIDVRQLAKLKDDGTLDKSWRFDANAAGYKNQLGRSKTGPNGSIKTIMHTDGKIVAWGSFTKFDETDKGRLVRLNADGGIDNSFNIGTGANANILSLSYNAALNKYLLCGIFTKFNGADTPFGMVMLNYDGSVDASFVPKTFDGGVPTYVKLLDDGLAVVAGAFRTYNGVARNSFMFLNASGNLADGYNNTGNFNGTVVDILETRSADNKRALLVMGSFSIFDSKPRNNIIRITIE